MRSTLFLIGLLLCVAGCKHEPQLQPLKGSNNTPNDTTGNNPAENDSVSFQTEILPMLQSNCAMSGCHAQQNPQEGIRLNSYAGVMNSGVIRIGDPDKSELVEMIEESKENKRMPPPPAPRLSPAQIALIRKWISEGARNTNIPRCDTTIFTFGAVNNIVTTACKGCHGAANPNGGVNLADHASIKNAAQNGKMICAIEHAAGCTPMPYNGTRLESCKITTIKKWVAAGCPQN